MSTDVSFIKALQNYFSEGGGRKLTIPEMKDLTYSDKIELHAELLKVGHECSPPVERAAA
jgi:hypothetical protein